VACGKRTYEKRKHAKRAMKAMNRKHGHTLENIYFCDRCNGYHLTTMDKADSRKMTRKKFKQEVNKELADLRKAVLKA
jgi:hypothetical protein